MRRFARSIRLLPIVILATVSLLALKVTGLVVDGGYTLGERLAARGKPGMTITTAESVPAYPKIVVADKPRPKPSPDSDRLSWAEQMFNYGGDANPDITGSVHEEPKGPPLKVSKKPPPPTKLTQSGPGGGAMVMAAGQIASPGEQAVLARLQDRRKQLDSRSRDLDMRESLLKAAEKRVEARVAELKSLEAKVNTAVTTRDKVEVQRFKGLVTMYEQMRAKDAARIFDHLDLNILVEVATKMKPRNMSAILAQMSPQSAERLTVELASRASANGGTTGSGQSPDQLPKIQSSGNEP